MEEKGYRIVVEQVEKEYPEGTTYEQIAMEYEGKYEAPIVLANVGGETDRTV